MFQGETAINCFVLGSMLYYSPEIFSGQRYMGPEVDCWCLGVTLFRMTAGFEPFAHARSKLREMY